MTPISVATTAALNSAAVNTAALNERAEWFDDPITPGIYFERTILFSPTYGTSEDITVTVNYDDGTLLHIYSDLGLTQSIDNPFSLDLTTRTIAFYVSSIVSYYNVVLTGGNLVGAITIDVNGG